MRHFLQLLCLLTVCMPTFLHAQPKKPLDLPAIKKAIDTISTGGEITLNFNFTTTEIKGEVKSAAQTKEINSKRRQVILQAIQQKPTDIKLYVELYNLAADTTQQREYREICANLIQTKLKETPQDGELYFEMGRLYQSIYSFNEAMEQYGQAQQYMPDSAKVYQKAGELFFYSQQYGRAKEMFADALKRDKDNLDMHFFYITADVFMSMTELTKNNSEDAVLKIAQSITQDLSYLEQTITQNLTRQDLIDFKVYAHFFWIFYKGFITGTVTSSINQTDFDKPENMRIEKFFYLSPQDRQELQALQEEFLGIIKKGKVKNLSLAHEAVAMISLLTGDNKNALNYLKKANTLNPEKTQIYYNTAFVHFLQQAPPKVEETIRTKMKYEQKATDFTTIAAIYKQAKDYEKAKNICKEGITALSHTPSQELYGMLGSIEAITGNYVEAKKYLLKAQTLSNTENAELIYKLALVELAQADWENAKISLQYGTTLQHEGCKKIFTTYFE